MDTQTSWDSDFDTSLRLVMVLPNCDESLCWTINKHTKYLRPENEKQVLIQQSLTGIGIELKSLFVFWFNVDGRVWMGKRETLKPAEVEVVAKEEWREENELCRSRSSSSKREEREEEKIVGESAKIHRLRKDGNSFKLIWRELSNEADDKMHCWSQRERRLKGRGKGRLLRGREAARSGSGFGKFPSCFPLFFPLPFFSLLNVQCIQCRRRPLFPLSVFPIFSLTRSTCCNVRKVFLPSSPSSLFHWHLERKKKDLPVITLPPSVFLLLLLSPSSFIFSPLFPPSSTCHHLVFPLLSQLLRNLFAVRMKRKVCTPTEECVGRKKKSEKNGLF